MGDGRLDEGVDVGARDEFKVGIRDGAEDFADLAGAEGDNFGGTAFHGARPIPALHGIPRDANGLLDGDAAHFWLIDVDADANGVEFADAGDGISGAEVGAIFGGQAIDGAGDGGDDGAESDFGLDGGDIGGGFADFGLRGGNFVLADDGAATLL